MTAAKRKEVRVDGLAEPLSHYTDVVVWGDLAFISGCISVDESGALVGEGDIKAQTRQTLSNLDLALTAVDSSFANVVKVTVYLLDVEDRQAVNDVRREFFGDALPASTLVQVSLLAVPGARIEIEAVAGVGSPS